MDVSVCITAYNLEKYIRECIESVLNQNFKGSYEIVICDDNSSDKTAEIIQNIIQSHPKGKLINYIKNNPNLGYVKNTLLTFERAKGKYIAVLDGDDYFIDMLKLQKQFDFLETHQNFTAVGADSLVIYDSADQLPSHRFSNHLDRELSKDELTDLKICQTSTLFFKKDILKADFPTEINSADRCLYLLAGCFGNMKILPEVLCSYRQYPTSHSKSQKHETLARDLQIVPFIKKYNKEYKTYSLKRYFYYTTMTYPSLQTKWQFYKTALGYFYYNMIEKVSKNPRSIYGDLKWTLKTIKEKLDIKKQSTGFITEKK